MTRVNVGIKVRLLSDEHLRAEHREIKRVCARFSKRIQIDKFNDIPNEFTLGKGHELFFINKGKYTFKRYKEIYNECIKRGFNVTSYHDNWSIYDTYNAFFNDYTESNNDRLVLIERIHERINNSTQKWHYYSKHISNNEYKELILREE